MRLNLSWTDYCFFIVLIISLLLVLKSLKKKHISLALSKLIKKPIAVSAGIILLFFLTIAIIDSIHYQTSTNTTISVLDYLVAPLGTLYEKTYSAPMSLTLYNQATILKNGHAQQIYPRLRNISNNVKTKEDVQRIKFKVVIQALVIGVFITLLIALTIFVLTHKINIAQWSALLTIMGLIMIVLICYWLSRDLHIFGTGKIGEDIFYFTLKSIRTGLIIGLLTTLFMLPLALFLGISAGYFGGMVDDIIQYIYTTLSSIPGVLLITASVLSMQTFITNHPEQFPSLADAADARLLALCLILGITSWTSLCRLLRAETLKLREIDYVLAARAMGSSSMTIIRKHLLPNLMHIVLITLVLDFSFLVLAEAVLAYVGVGVSPTTISWGNMINSARLELAREPLVWWPMLSALTFMFVLVLASNLFADAVREVFDPRR
jgi:peptide/nickel transport system permease protein